MKKTSYLDSRDPDGIIAHTTPSDGNIFSDLGFAEPEARRLKAQSDTIVSEKLRIKEMLMIEISNWIKQNSLRQADAVVLLGINRPRVSDIVQKKTGKFTIDALIDMLGKAGRQVDIAVSSREIPGQEHPPRAT